ncbi:hypothetical protein PP1_005500 [Pseudonocardia sp. P1]
MSFDKLSARAAAHRSWGATRDRSARTSAGRSAADRRFEEQARELLGAGASEFQVRQSAESLRKAYFADLARRSAAARRAA